MIRAILRTVFRKLHLLESAQKLLLSWQRFHVTIRFRLFLPVFSLNGFLSSVYYAFFSGAFYREHKAVMKGMLEYYSVIRRQKTSDFLLIHNIHSIEKGLCMRPRRDIFGVEYIRETVKAYTDYLALPLLQQNADQLKWFRDVLEEYFSVTGNHTVINAARKEFRQLAGEASDGERHIPYERGETGIPPVKHEDFLQLAKRRRSIRWFLQKPVPRDLLDKAIEITLLSPSACNRQPFEFRIFDDPKWVDRIQQLPSGTKGFGYNFPVICVIVGTLGAYINERDKHAIYVDGGLAAMSFMYALETLGLSSCPLNWPDISFREKGMQKALGLASCERPIVVIAVGYADPKGLIAYSQKKRLEAVRKYNGQED
jgi:nitroreductase